MQNSSDRTPSSEPSDYYQNTFKTTPNDILTHMDNTDFIEEAKLAIGDIGSCVQSSSLSTKLNDYNKPSIAYLNMRSTDNQEYCIELSKHGYRVVGKKFDDNRCPSPTYYESLQALFTQKSQSYVQSFADNLRAKLNAELQHEQLNKETEEKN
ncbi:unnamed protein product [Didymodactylos carnosus]|uniref:GSKIP domain-containing protein n=1 Tax=Didymodactylos carnosus TaxID=1234261 RepID=A0A813ZR65_9BILA|nr:unnamed protein product [Didymodactylos carnosus]CAF0902324.1 unnamed protein product [Didymodactylos carnosus]CAF3598792.1 unnamed protein product [Didymodactylos carnosus]CAF3684614.1 unnamed protein product [Didymodactylos carnosus]